MLPDGRGLNEQEVTKISNAVDEFVCTHQRDGCISFVAKVEGEGITGYQHILFKNRWVYTVTVDDNENIPFEDAVDRHMTKTRDVIRKLYELDTRKGNEYPYMKQNE